MGNGPDPRTAGPGSSPTGGKLRASERANALHAHEHICAKDAICVWLEPTTLAHAAQAITKLTKWSGGPSWFALGFVLVLPLSNALRFYCLKTTVIVRAQVLLT